MTHDLMGRDGGFGVYIHWPYCAAKCPYCDFNSYAVPGEIDQPRFQAAISRELVHFAERTQGREVTSIFFGGGTPSLMEPQTVGAILDQIAALWPVAPDAEITLEANPSSVEAGRFAGYRAAGVGRVSLGVQSLRDGDLRFLGRLHSADEARVALTIARQHFERVSVDLIYARPEQTVAAWREELTEALALGTRHLSAYQLTIEPGTAFFRLHQAGKLVTPVDEIAADLFDVTQELCEQAGLYAYEVSNHAIPGEESRHNLTYWRYGEYVGVGPGAHGRIRHGRDGRIATSTIRDPAAWLAAVDKEGVGLAETLEITPAEQAEEMLLMGLRLREGVSLARMRALTGQSVDEAAIRELEDMGLMELRDGSVLRATPDGRFVLNHIVLQLAKALGPVGDADASFIWPEQVGKAASA